MIDVEAEAIAIRERSAELVGLLVAATPVADRTPIREAQAEAARLAAAAHAARREVAVKIAAGLPAGVPVGRARPIRRVKTDARGRDLDGVLKGRAVITPQLLRCLEHQRDVVGPTIEGAYRRAAEDRPYQAALVAAVHGHVGLLQLRQSYKSEGGVEIEAALLRYEASYASLREGIVEGQNVVTAAMGRLENLEKEAALGLVGTDEAIIEGVIASAVAGVMPDQVIGTDGSTVGVTVGKR